MKLYLLAFILLFFGLQSKAQNGCTDPQAANYDPLAISNDGSCIYLETNYTLPLIVELPQSLLENSGLAVIDGALYTHNDAGNPNEIYQIDTLDGSVLQTLLVVGDNDDWEDMAESETHLFLGNFGNNKGDRTDLQIYKIDKTGLETSNIVNAQPINFSFADQVDFSDNQNNHDFDCEAFFFHDDSLHLFTKNWVDNQTRHYVIPSEPGNYPVQPSHTFDVGGLITAADISEDGVVVLLGYTEFSLNFMWMLQDYQGNHFFSGHKRKINLGSALVNSQTEGIAFKNKFQGYISSEEFNSGPLELAPKLLSFDIEQWIVPDIPDPVGTKEEKVRYDLQVFPNPFFDKLHLELPDNWPTGETEIRLINSNGKLLMAERSNSFTENFNLNIAGELPDGIYIVQLVNESALWQKRIVKGSLRF